MTRREATGTGEDPESGFNLLGCSLTYIAWHSSGIGVLSLLDRAQSMGRGDTHHTFRCKVCRAHGPTAYRL